MIIVVDTGRVYVITAPRRTLSKGNVFTHFLSFRLVGGGIHFGQSKCSLGNFFHCGTPAPLQSKEYGSPAVCNRDSNCLLVSTLFVWYFHIVWFSRHGFCHTFEVTPVNGFWPRRFVCNWNGSGDVGYLFTPHGNNGCLSAWILHQMCMYICHCLSGFLLASSENHLLALATVFL